MCSWCPPRLIVPSDNEPLQSERTYPHTRTPSASFKNPSAAVNMDDATSIGVEVFALVMWGAVFAVFIYRGYETWRLPPEQRLFLFGWLPWGSNQD
ncbi:hypothetical protein M434DRAFT_334913 [Hypoxylon sp. CO27-5]|nr:hypothetical protein M434DRAFT_334913 [Hypoxylon sp. CO27-5]